MRSFEVKLEGFFQVREGLFLLLSLARDFNFQALEDIPIPSFQINSDSRTGALDGSRTQTPLARSWLRSAPYGLEPVVRLDIMEIMRTA